MSLAEENQSLQQDSQENVRSGITINIEIKWFGTGKVKEMTRRSPQHEFANILHQGIYITCKRW